MIVRAIPICIRSSVPVALLLYLFSVFPADTPASLSRAESSADQAVPPDTMQVVEPGREPLRILAPTWPGASEMSNAERELLNQFTEAENLAQHWIPVKRPGDISQMLADGTADIVVSLRDPITGLTGKDALYTLPWGVSRRQIVGRSGSARMDSISNLTARQVAVRQSSPVWPLMSALAAKHPGMQLLGIPDNVGVSTVLERVRSGRYDLAVVDSLLIPADLNVSYQLEVLMDLSEDVFLNWAVRADAVTLHASLNRFLNKKHLELETARSYREDFSGLKARKMLRLVTTRSAVNYYHNRGRLKGFEYDLMKKFANSHGMRLDVVIADSVTRMQQLLNEGGGDVIAASLPEDVDALSDAAQTRPYNYATPVIAGREGELITDLRDLEGRIIHLPASSPYLDVLEGIRARGIHFTVLVADPGITTEGVLFRVARGIDDLTVIGSHEVNAEFAHQLNMKAYISLVDPQALVWRVRKSDTQLLSQLNDFIGAEYRKGFYNVIYSKYIEKPDARSANVDMFAGLDQLSPYDEIVHKYADEYSFDWRLIVALMYQESRFNPAAVSTSGAEGLMQILPTTAETIGLADLSDPDSSINAGVRYLDQLRSQFENELALSDRLWFALAAYNSGYTRVQRARALAEKMHLDKNRWFNNVELAMLKMSAPYRKDGEVVRNCRCGQTVAYVREIRTLYNNYLRLTQSVKAAAETVLPREKS